MADSCATCKFYDEGLCVRYAPRPVMEDAVDIRRYNVAWPEVLPDDWCGEWAAIPAPA